MQCSTSLAGQRPLLCTKMHRNTALRPQRMCTRMSAAQQATKQQYTTADVAGLDLLSLSVASSLLWSQPLAAWADETAAESTAAAVAEGAQQAAAGAAEAAAQAPAPSWLSYVVVLLPIIMYAIFNVYRSQVNPRIKFSDFLFIVAGVAVVANLVSIIGFKVRLF